MTGREGRGSERYGEREGEGEREVGESEREWEGQIGIELYYNTLTYYSYFARDVTTTCW